MVVMPYPKWDFQYIGGNFSDPEHIRQANEWGCIPRRPDLYRLRRRRMPSPEGANVTIRLNREWKDKTWPDWCADCRRITHHRIASRGLLSAAQCIVCHATGEPLPACRINLH